MHPTTSVDAWSPSESHTSNLLITASPLVTKVNICYIPASSFVCLFSALSKKIVLFDRNHSFWFASVF